MKPDELIELLRAVSNDGGLIEEPFAVIQHNLELECKECGHSIKHTTESLCPQLNGVTRQDIRDLVTHFDLIAHENQAPILS
jgi:hypothetical protein